MEAAQGHSKHALAKVAANSLWKLSIEVVTVRQVCTSTSSRPEPICGVS